MNPRLALAAFCVLLPACSACSACSGRSEKTDNSSGPGADADAAAEAGPLADARPETFQEASPPDAGPTDSEVVDGASAVPTWTLLPGQVAGCPIERISNPEQIRLFTWAPCAGTPNCERAVISEGVLPGDLRYQAWGPACTVSDKSGTVRLGLVQAGLGQVFFAFEDGRVFDGYRPARGNGCQTGGSAMWGDRYGVPILLYPPNGAAQAGGVLQSFGSAAEPVLFNLPQFSGGPQATWMGSERWAWWWVMPENLISMSTSDGGDATIFAPTDMLNGPVLSLGRGTTTGSLFLFPEDVLPEGGRIPRSLPLRTASSRRYPT